MNYKGISFLLIFIFVHFLVYIYFKNKYSSKNKNISEIKYIVPPVTYEDFFIFKDLSKYYDSLFGNEVDELNLIKSQNY